MKKLISPIQKAIAITAVAAGIMVILRCGSLEMDRISTEQFFTIQSLSLLYIVFVWAVYQKLGNLKNK